MAKRKPDTGAIYISPRLRASLEPVGRCALTVVTAPMGYGKTTAINWYLNERGREGAAVLRVSIYSANRAIFWKSLQKAFAQAGLTVLEGYECPTDASGAALLLDDLCTALAGEREIDLFLDHFHLLRDEQAARSLPRCPPLRTRQTPTRPKRPSGAWKQASSGLVRTAISSPASAFPAGKCSAPISES